MIHKTFMVSLPEADDSDDRPIFPGEVRLWKLSRETRRMIRADNVKPTDLVAWPVTQTYSGVTSEQAAALRKACLKPRWSKAKKKMMAKRRNAPNLFKAEWVGEGAHLRLSDASYNELIKQPLSVLKEVMASWAEKGGAPAACADPASRFPNDLDPSPRGRSPYSETTGKGASSLRAAEDIMAALRDVVKGGR